jgi:hypothetical protein
MTVETRPTSMFAEIAAANPELDSNFVQDRKTLESFGVPREAINTFSGAGRYRFVDDLFVHDAAWVDQVDAGQLDSLVQDLEVGEATFLARLAGHDRRLISVDIAPGFKPSIVVAALRDNGWTQESKSIRVQRGHVGCPV